MTRTAAQPSEVDSTGLYVLSFLKQSSNGNEHFVDRMLEVFLRETPATLVALQQACTANDWQTVAQLAHGMKPIVLLLRIQGGATAIQTLEAPATKPEEALKAALFLCQQLQLTCQAIKQELHPE